MRVLSQASEETGCAVILIHHAGKTDPTKAREETPARLARVPIVKVPSLMGTSMGAVLDYRVKSLGDPTGRGYHGGLEAQPRGAALASERSCRLV
jgi:hypothetical protein